ARASVPETVSKASRLGGTDQTLHSAGQFLLRRDQALAVLADRQALPFECVVDTVHRGRQTDVCEKGRDRFSAKQKIIGQFGVYFSLSIHDCLPSIPNVL